MPRILAQHLEPLTKHDKLTQRGAPWLHQTLRGDGTRISPREKIYTPESPLPYKNAARELFHSSIPRQTSQQQKSSPLAADYISAMSDNKPTTAEGRAPDEIQDSQVVNVGDEKRDSNIEHADRASDEEKQAMQTPSVTAPIEALGIPDWREQEKKIVRRLDMTLMPMLWVLYLFNYLDRASIS